MNRPKFTFGAIKLNVNKLSESDAKEEETGTSASTSGFGKFGTFENTEKNNEKNKKAIEDLSIEDTEESENTKKVMGFSSFERKSKNFDINEMMKRARENAPKPRFMEPDQEDDGDVVGPMPPPAIPEKVDK